MKKGIRTTIVGCLLLLLSAPLVFLMGVEIYCEQKAQRQFSTWNVKLNEAHYYVMDNGDIGIESTPKAFITEDNVTPKYRDDLKLQDIQLSNRGTMGNFKLQLLYGNSTIQLMILFP
ncbi:hypothetical protein [Mesobacillus zeae]|uniref:Uncharacterized protein n=1 Tax=Mesobacillus zeae TaxID=1917180 RepID=A0A398AYL2_9BACI|nr:hypothetical protein [Mesobacillus zeae]RID82697.1 hypothetical protein D1970_18370 [Mesobacillus zeae]